jgi:hypothetical protein
VLIQCPAADKTLQGDLSDFEAIGEALKGIATALPVVR